MLVDAPGAAQTYFLMGNIGVSRKYADRAPLDVVNTLFGGRFTSMLKTGAPATASTFTSPAPGVASSTEAIRAPTAVRSARRICTA